MFASLAMRSNGYNDQLLAGGFLKNREGFLIFGPKPTLDSFFYIFKGFLLRFALRNAPRQRRTLDNDPTVLGFFKRYVKCHRFVCSSIVETSIIVVAQRALNLT